MSKAIYSTVVLGSLACVVGVLFAATRRGSDRRNAETENVAAPGEPADSSIKHLATPGMIAGSDRAAGRRAPPFRAEGHDGRSYSLSDAPRKHPLVLVFIKVGCPCSESAEPFFRRVREAYRGKAAFLGVIDGDADVARNWAEANDVSYPLLIDPDLKIVASYGAENSAYVALVAPDGRIDKMWAGYSAEMLRDLGHRLARLEPTEEVPLDVDGAPDLLYTGCPY